MGAKQKWMNRGNTLYVHPSLRKKKKKTKKKSWSRVRGRIWKTPFALNEQPEPNPVDWMNPDEQQYAPSSFSLFTGL